MNLQPLNICLSYQGTLNLVEAISEGYDVAVEYWGDELKKKLTSLEQVSMRHCVMHVYTYHKKVGRKL